MKRPWFWLTIACLATMIASPLLAFLAVACGYSAIGLASCFLLLLACVGFRFSERRYTAELHAGVAATLEKLQQDILARRVVGSEVTNERAQ